MEHIRAHGIDVRFDVCGHGPWVTLAHALGSDLTIWNDLAARLASHFTVLRFDTRGHGGSTATRAPYTLAGLADDAVALLDALGVACTHFVGLSMGGMIGQYLAATHPRRIDRLVVADSACRYPPEARSLWSERVAIVRGQGMDAMVEGTLARWFTAPYRHANPDVMAWIGGLLRSTPVEGYAGCGLAVAELDLTGLLPRIAAPTLVLVGDQDAGTPPAMAREIQAGIPGARLQVIADASHLSPIEQAAVFNHAVLDFLRGRAN